MRKRSVVIHHSWGREGKGSWVRVPTVAAWWCWGSQWDTPAHSEGEKLHHIQTDGT